MADGDSKRLTELTVSDAKRGLVYGAVLSLSLWLLVALLGRTLVALLLGVIAAVYLLPIQKWFERRLGASEGSALVTIALIVAPLAALTGYVGYELSDYTDLAQERRQQMIRDLSDALARYLPVAPGSMRAGLELAFAEAMTNSLSALQSLRRQAPLLLASLTLFFFTVFYVLTQRAKISAYIKLRVPGDYLPLYERLAANIGGALRGALRAVFIDQSLKAVVILLLNLAFDVPLAAALAVVTFLIGFFPLLGEWAVYGPVSVYLLVFRREPVSAAIYLGVGVGMTLASSLLLRPRLASGGARHFNFYWMLVAFVAGVYSFGIPGLVLGPAILGFVKAVIDTLTVKVDVKDSLLVAEVRRDKDDQANPTYAQTSND
jgi:predicted PurR-regulated permease PerM